MTNTPQNVSSELKLLPRLIRYWSVPGRDWWGWLLFLVSQPILTFSVQMGLVVLASMVIHELCHGAALFYGMNAKFRIIPIWPFAALAMPANAEEKAKADQAHWFWAAWFTLAGPVGTVALVFLGMFLQLLSNPLVRDIGTNFVLANTVLAAMNLIPLGKLDGGQFVFIIYSSLKECYDKVLAWFVSGTIVVFFALVLLLPLVSRMFSFLENGMLRLWIAMMLSLLGVGFWIKQDDDKPEHSQSIQAMSIFQILLHLFVYAVLNLLTILFLLQIRI